MSEEQAALEEDLNEPLGEQGAEDPTPNEDPAPSPEDTPAKPDPVQARINTLVGQKHEERRAKEAAEQRAAELERQLQTQAPVKSNGAPKLEDFDYDDAKYQDALIDYKVNQKTQEFQQQQEQITLQREQQEVQNKWNSKLTTMKEEDYQETVALIPPLPTDTLQTLMQADNGPKLAYYLGKHLDVADELSRLPPTIAAMRLGEISAQLSNKNPTTKPSAAPDPVDPINSGGTASSERGASGARYE